MWRSDDRPQIIDGRGIFATAAIAYTGDPRFPFDVAKLMSDQGIMGITIPQMDGGVGGTLMDAVIATIAVMNPPSLAIVCVDNGHYGETGWQKRHTSLGVISRRSRSAAASSAHMTVAQDSDLERGSRFIREGNSAGFVLLRVKPTEPPPFTRNLDAAFCRDRFRSALQV